MNRRALLTAIAAIPFIGRIVPASALPMPQPIALGNVRDLLLPGLWGACGKEGPLYDPIHRLDADIQIDFSNDRLLVKVISRDQTKWATGIISREDIRTDIYKYKFLPLLIKLKQTALASDARDCLIVTMNEVKAEYWS